MDTSAHETPFQGYTQDGLSAGVAIRLEHLSKVYPLYDRPADRMKEALHPFRKKYHREFYALNDISFEVARGDRVGVLGQNGAGKSTLLKIITGVLTPTSGRVNVKGRVSSLLELGTGFNGELTGIENVYLSGTINGFSKDEMDAKLDGILSFADIGEFVNQPVKMYSSGMYVRLAFAVAIQVDPDILIVDEALSVGDMFFQAKCMARMKKMMDGGVTLLFVSHSFDQVASLCRHAILLSHGQLERIGPAKEVAQAYVQSFVSNNNTAKEAAGFGKLPAVENAVLATSEPAGISEERRENFKKNIAREGTGAAEIEYVEILDADGNDIENAMHFNQPIEIRVHVVFHEKVRSVAVAYHLLTANRLFATTFTTHPDTDLHSRVHNPGERLVVSFKTAFPVLHGQYSITALVDTLNDWVTFTDVIFLDWVDNAVVFEMKKREPIQMFDLFEIESTRVSVNYAGSGRFPATGLLQ